MSIRDDLYERMERKVIIRSMYSGTTPSLVAYYDSLTAPPLESFINSADIEYIRKIIASPRYSGNFRAKKKKIDECLNFRGFTEFAGGTNRVVYTHPKAPNLVFKVAMDIVGINDNPAEYYNQQFIKPFCCKVFEVSPCGTIGVFEKVHNFTNFEEYFTNRLMIYRIVMDYLAPANIIMADIGDEFFMNWGTRIFDGVPLLLDFPYAYETDNEKIICNNILEDGSRCYGDIDYDVGFNFLKCEKCGKIFDARELVKDPKSCKGILMKSEGVQKMKVYAMRGGKVEREFDSGNTSNTYVPTIIRKPKAKTICPIATTETVYVKKEEADLVVEKKKVVEEVVEEVKVIPATEEKVENVVNEEKSEEASVETEKEPEIISEEKVDSVIDPVSDTSEDTSKNDEAEIVYSDAAKPVNIFTDAIKNASSKKEKSKNKTSKTNKKQFIVRGEHGKFVKADGTFTKRKDKDIKS